MRCSSFDIPLKTNNHSSLLSNREDERETEREEDRKDDREDDR